MEYLKSKLSYGHYIRPEWFEREKKAFFSYPILLAHIKEIPSPGNFVSLTLFNENIVLVNDQGRPRVFLNHCPHRGARLCGKAQGRMEHFHCPYHGLKFDLSGRSLDREGAETLKMIEYPAYQEGPWIFARFDAHAPETRVHLPQELVGLDGGLQTEFSRGYFSQPLAINWKYFIENTIESYHVARVHPGLDKIIGRECRWSFKDRYAEMAAPLSAPSEAPGSEDLYLRMARDSGFKQWTYYFIFPNTHITIFPEQIHFFTVLPQTVDKSVVRGYYLYSPGEDRKMRIMRYLNWRISLQIWREDVRVLNALQGGSAYLGRELNLSLHPQREDVILFFQQQLMNMVGEHAVAND